MTATSVSVDAFVRDPGEIGTTTTAEHGPVLYLGAHPAHLYIHAVATLPDTTRAGIFRALEKAAGTCAAELERRAADAAATRAEALTVG